METVKEEWIGFAHKLADEAGAIIRRYFRTPMAVDTKADDSPVTLADKEAEAAIRALIAKHYPSHGIIGEEGGNTNTDSDYIWIIDPIDGTRSFITGRPLFGTLIALAHKGAPILGILDQPINKERWLGLTGGVTTMNGSPVHTRPCPALAQAMMSTTSPHLFAGMKLQAFERVSKAARHTSYGGDCYAYGQITLGLLDLVIESGLKPYDFAALVPIINGAGGIVTDWQGKPVTLASNGDIIAAGDKHTHAQALELLKA